MNIGALLGLRVARRNGFIHRLRAFDGIGRLGNIGVRRLFLHTAVVATYLPL